MTAPLAADPAESPTTRDPGAAGTLRAPSMRRIRRAGLSAWSLVGIAVAVALVCWLLWTIRLVVLPVAVAGIAAAGLAPIHSRFVRLGLSGGLAAVVVMLLMAGLLAGAGFLIVPGMVDQLDDVGAALTEAADRLERWVARERPFGMSGDDVSSLRARIEEAEPSAAFDAIGLSARTGARAAGAIVTSVLLVLVTTFFLLRDGARFGAVLTAAAPARHRDRVAAALTGVVRSLRGYLAGAATLGIVEGIAIGLALWLTGADLALVVVALTFLGAFVPFVGAIVVGVVAVGVALVSGGTTSAIIVAVVVVLVQQLDNELLAPLIYGRLLQLHPLAVILGTALGIEVAGLIGAFITVPLIAAMTGGWRGAHEVGASGP
jgi:predicted PurR-regulated permease PerM